MKIYQPLAMVGFSFGGALLVTSLLPFRFVFAAVTASGALFFGVLIFCLIRGFCWGRGVLCVACCMMLLGTAINATQRMFWAKKATEFSPVPVTVEGIVLENYGIRGQVSSYLIETRQVEDSRIPGKTKLLIYGNTDVEFYKGEQIRCKIVGNTNVPSRSQIGKGASATGWIQPGTEAVLKEAASNQWLEKLSSHLKVNVKSVVPSPYDSIIIAMLLGDSTQMDTGLSDCFQLTGISHILCISGLHITMIGGLIAGLLQLIFGKRMLPDLVGLLAMVFFVVLTGGKISAIRALIMTATLLLSRHLIRDYSPLNTLGGIVLLFCLFEPQIVYHTGFLMSVVSVCALCVAAPCWLKAVLERLSVHNRALRYIISLLCSSCAVAVFLMPITMLFNGYTSLLSPVANLMVLPMTPCVMTVGAVCAVFGYTPIGMIAGDLCCVLLKVMTAIVKTLGKVSAAVLPLNLSCTVLWLMMTVLLVSFLLIAGRLRQGGKMAAGISAGLLMLGITMQWIGNRDVMTLAVLESGDDYSLVVSQNGKGLVIGCGDRTGQKAVHYMRSIGVSDFEMMVALKNNAAQAGGVSRILLLSRPDIVLGPMDGNYLSAAYGLSDCQLEPITASEREVLDTISLTVEEKDGFRAILSGNGQRFFVDDDGRFGILQNGKEWVLREGEAAVLAPKYNRLTADVMEELEAGSFESIRRGEVLVVRAATNGKMTIRRK